MEQINIYKIKIYEQWHLEENSVVRDVVMVAVKEAVLVNNVRIMLAEVVFDCN